MPEFILDDIEVLLQRLAGQECGEGGLLELELVIDPCCASLDIVDLDVGAASDPVQEKLDKVPAALDVRAADAHALQLALVPADEFAEGQPSADPHLAVQPVELAYLLVPDKGFEGPDVVPYLSRGAQTPGHCPHFGRDVSLQRLLAELYVCYLLQLLVQLVLLADATFLLLEDSDLLLEILYSLHLLFTLLLDASKCTIFQPAPAFFLHHKQLAQFFLQHQSWHLHFLCYLHFFCLSLLHFRLTLLHFSLTLLHFRLPLLDFELPYLFAQPLEVADRME